MLKTFYKLSLYIFLFSYTLNAFGQCSTCQPDTMCIPEVQQPSVCPEIMPNATSGEYYEEVMTFYLPSNFDDPGTGQNVTINEVVITSVTGLPFGIDYTLNNSNLTYYPSDGENFGCATICGTPILAGVYDVSITSHVYVEVLGFNLEVDEVFVNTLIVEQGESGNSSFTIDQNAGCGMVEATFDALINSVDQPTDWSWDFDNGNTSTEQHPTTQIFDEPGEYTVSLTTQLWNYTLQEVNLIEVGGDWAGDVEEPIASLANPDPYFVVKDSLNNVVFTSEVVNNSFSNTWGDLGIVLGNPPYTIEFYDDDNVSADDFLGSFSLDVNAGYQNFDDGESNGLFLVELVNSDTFYDDEIVSVFPEPTFDFVVDEENNTITIVGDSSLTGFVWLLNGEVMSSTDSIIEMDEGGFYSCNVLNNFGCQTSSEEYIHCPEFVPEYDEMNDLLFAPEGFLSYQWFLDGLPIEGANSSTLAAPSDGNYAVEIETEYGCDVQSEWLIYTGIYSISEEAEIQLFPNPASDFISIELLPYKGIVKLYSLQGQLLDEFEPLGKQKLTIDLKLYNPGTYVLVVENKKGNAVVKRFNKL